MLFSHNIKFILFNKSLRRGHRIYNTAQRKASKERITACKVVIPSCNKPYRYIGARPYPDRGISNWQMGWRRYKHGRGGFWILFAKKEFICSLVYCAKREKLRFWSIKMRTFDVLSQGYPLIHYGGGRGLSWPLGEGAKLTPAPPPY